MNATHAAFVLVLAFLACTDAKPRHRGPYIVTNWFLLQGLSETPFTDCGSTATINKIEVIPCDENECPLKSGSNATINIEFTPKTDVNRLTAVVHGVVAGIPMPFHFPQANACQNSNITCPMKAGQDYFYSVQLPVRQSYPKIKVIVKWQLMDGTGKNVICVEIPSRIV